MDPAKVPKLDPAQLGCACRISSIWGMNDQALLPVARATLADYCDDLTVREIAGADHWVVHQKTDEVIGHIREFLGAEVIAHVESQERSPRVMHRTH